jgi:[ribosomal protein S5]-alanine N-acetyltransferase
VSASHSRKWIAITRPSGQYAFVSRLELRPPRLADWERVHEWASRPEVCRYQVWGPNSSEETRAFVAAAVATWDQSESQRSRYVWVAEHPDEGVVGMGELNVRSRVHRQGEISYIVHPDLWGQGFGTQIAEQVLVIGFDDFSLHRIFGTCDPRNEASAAILRGLGMRHEGSHRHTLLLRDGWRDSEVFAVIADEWKPSPPHP